MATRRRSGGKRTSAIKNKPRPTIKRITNIKLIWENFELKFVGTVPLPRPKGKPVAVLISLPELR